MNKEVDAFGIIGLGTMGGNLATQALEKDLRVVGYARRGPPQALTDAGLERADGIEEFRDKLSRPRLVFLYVPAGPAVDSVLDELAQSLEPGDVVVDGGNSYWGDSIVRYERMKARDLHFVDLGTSGGLAGARGGACFMAGGDHQALALIEPVLKTLATEDGYVHAGPAGAGHFTKLVHNGIEFGMLQAIGEGMDLLERYREELPVADILRAWSHGSVIRSWLIELMEQQYRAQDGLESVPGYIEDTGEVNWLVDDAMHMEVPVPVISQSVMQLLASRDNDRNWARAVAMMRHGFGDHPFGAEEHLAKSRQTSRVGGFRRKD